MPTQYQRLLYECERFNRRCHPSARAARPGGRARIEIDHLKASLEYFKVGMKNFSGVWQNILAEDDIRLIGDLSRIDKPDQFRMPIETWVKIVYQYAGTFHESPRQRFKIIDTMIPLYYARIASLVNELKAKNAMEAEDHFEAQAKCFEDLKGYMIEIWNRKGGA
jgi:hypothetical protein